MRYFKNTSQTQKHTLNGSENWQKHFLQHEAEMDFYKKISMSTLQAFLRFFSDQLKHEIREF